MQLDHLPPFCSSQSEFNQGGKKSMGVVKFVSKVRALKFFKQYLRSAILILFKKLAAFNVKLSM